MDEKTALRNLLLATETYRDDVEAAKDKFISKQRELLDMLLKPKLGEPAESPNVG